MADFGNKLNQEPQFDNRTSLTCLHRLRPACGNQQTIACKDFTVQFLGQERHERVKQAQCAFQNGAGSGTCFSGGIGIIIVQAWFDKLDIPIAIGIPDEMISYVGFETIKILLENPKSDYLFYFYNIIKKEHIFSKNFNEHRKKLNEYRKKIK